VGQVYANLGLVGQLAVKSQMNVDQISEKTISDLIDYGNEELDSHLEKLKEKYSFEHLSGLSDREMYQLYKKHAANGDFLA